MSFDKKEWSKNYYQRVRKPKRRNQARLDAAVKEIPPTATEMGREAGFDPLSLLMTHCLTLQAASAEIRRYLEIERIPPYFDSISSAELILRDLEERMAKHASATMPFFYPHLSSVDHQVEGKVDHQISDEPMSDDQWNEQYGVAPTNGAAKGSH